MIIIQLGERKSSFRKREKMITYTTVGRYCVQQTIGNPASASKPQSNRGCNKVAIKSKEIHNNVAATKCWKTNCQSIRFYGRTYIIKDKQFIRNIIYLENYNYIGYNDFYFYLNILNIKEPKRKSATNNNNDSLVAVIASIAVSRHRKRKK